MPIDAAEVDALIAAGGTVFFADPFRDSTRQSQQQLLFVSILSFAFAVGLINTSDTVITLTKLPGVTDTRVIALALAGLLAYGMASYALAVQSDWGVYQHTVLPFRLKALATLGYLREELKQLELEGLELPDRAAADPMVPVDVHIEASVKRLQNAGFRGASHDAMVTDIERRATPLMFMLNRSRRLTSARQLLEPKFTYLFAAGSIVALYLRVCPIA